jgi:hypothetical protein
MNHITQEQAAKLYDAANAYMEREFCISLEDADFGERVMAAIENGEDGNTVVDELAEDYDLTRRSDFA